MFPRAINVFYRHTSMPTPKGPLDAARYAARLRPFDRLVMVAQATADAFLADFPDFASRTTTISNPIDVEAWRARVEDKQPLILFAGRAMPDKGLDLACAAIAQALDAAPEWRASLMLADWHMHGPWAEPHISALARFGERVSVRTNAPLSDVRAETRRAAIALTPSRVREGLSLSALEAHAAGAALVSSGRGGLREASGPHAVYVEPEYPAVLAKAILGLVADPVRRTALAKAGQDRVTRSYAPRVRAAELDALRGHLLAAQGRRHSRPQSAFGARLGVPALVSDRVF
jgi:glycosyltransferase involved in cell wall biosynthesis